LEEKNSENEKISQRIKSIHSSKNIDGVQGVRFFLLLMLILKFYKVKLSRDFDEFSNKFGIRCCHFGYRSSNSVCLLRVFERESSVR